MKDMFFYPLAALIIGGIIYYALSFRVDAAPVDPNIFDVSGTDLVELFPSPGTTVSLSADANGDTVLAILSAHTSRALSPPSAGVFGTLGPVHEASFGGKPVRITVRARAGRTTPSETFELGYFTAGAGDSEWQSFQISDDFTDHSFVYIPNPPRGEAGNDYVGIWPDPSGQNGTIEVMSVRVEKIVDAAPAPLTP